MQADVTALRCPVADCRESFDGDVLRQVLGAGPSENVALKRRFAGRSGLKRGAVALESEGRQAIRCAAQGL